MAKPSEELWDDEFDDGGDEACIPEEDEFSESVDKDFAARYTNLLKTWNPDS
ncbi:MAG TPA: hypothetical protein VFT23_06860 [Burkholderiales bacterium]|nr:hypothetical protein [Burkholderiales bacterium]